MNIQWHQTQTSKLNQISPSACLAKFYDLTIHLESGHNHSCVHPHTHKIPIDEIQQSVHALHNSEYKKTVRQQMLQGERPSECQYCWKMEDANKNIASDRIGLSSNLMSRNEGLIEEVVAQGHSYNYTPRHVEISFSTTCNFKCTYCGPFVSSRWMKDIEKFGPFTNNLQNINNTDMFTDKMPIKKDNQYVEAFWKWLPETYTNLTQLRVTGGEPLLSSNTFKLLDWIQQHPKHDLDLGINSNLGVPDKLFKRFINKVNEFNKASPVKSFTVWTSGESTHDQFNYIRLGGDYQQWLANIVSLLEIDNVNVKIMTTYSLLNVTSYLEFLQDIYALIRKYPGRLIIDTHTYLQHPKYLRVDLLTEEFIPIVQKQVDFIKEMHTQKIASDINVIHAERLLSFMEHSLQNPMSDLQETRQVFHQYIQDFDYRNGLDFKTTFPGLANFYDSCK
jgi:organic radical activating enzyme